MWKNASLLNQGVWEPYIKEDFWSKIVLVKSLKKTFLDNILMQIWTIWIGIHYTECIKEKYMSYVFLFERVCAYDEVTLDINWDF